MPRKRKFGGTDSCRPEYKVIYSPRSKTYSVTRKLGTGFGSSLIVAGGLTKEEAEAERKRREKAQGD